MKILFMDDDVERYDHLRKYLPSSIEIVHVYTVSEAQEKMMEQEFDLLMLDHDLGIGMVGGDGIELAKWISRSMDKYKWKPGCDVIIHSMNPVGAGNMVAELGMCSIQAKYIPGAWTMIREKDGGIEVRKRW